MDPEINKKLKKRRPVLQKTGRALSPTARKEKRRETDDAYGHLPDDEDVSAEGDKFMSLGDHLEELRKRIIAAAAVLLAFSIVVGIYSSEVHHILTEPFFTMDFSSLPQGGTPTKPLLTLGNFYGPLNVMINLSISIGFMLALPIVLLIFWGFVTPALSKKSATIGKFIVGSSSLLFWSGVYFCWKFVFPISVQYMLIGMMPEGTMPWISLEKYYSFLLMMHTGLGLLFQLPLLFVILGAMGVLNLAWHRRVWKYMMVGLTILAAVMTPPDVVSQVLFMIPLSILYGIALIIIWVIERGKRAVTQAE